MADKQSIDLSDKENLQKALEGFKEDYQDNTEYLREVKRSGILRDEVLKMERLKRSYKGDRTSAEFTELCQNECSFLFTHYTMIFNKMVKDVLDLKLMFYAIDTLRLIEEGLINQDEGSVKMGKLFADMFLDSAKREGEQLDQKYQSDKPVPVEGKAISWKQFKMRSKTF
jgi:hypothetical protein